MSMAQIDAASPAVLGINELLADEPRHRPKARRDLAEMLGAGLEVDIRRQAILDDCRGRLGLWTAPGRRCSAHRATDCLEGIKKSNGPRLIVVGGTGSLFVAPGITVRNCGHLPEELVPIVDAQIEAFRRLKENGIDWTCFSPAAFFEPGERTGKFRLCKDDLITDAQGNSRISFDDYAIALADELENPQHHRERFTVGY